MIVTHANYILHSDVPRSRQLFQLLTRSHVAKHYHVLFFVLQLALRVSGDTIVKEFATVKTGRNIALTSMAVVRLDVTLDMAVSAAI